jgi:hypothetical protein
VIQFESERSNQVHVGIEKFELVIVTKIHSSLTSFTTVMPYRLKVAAQLHKLMTAMRTRMREKHAG